MLGITQNGDSLDVIACIFALRKRWNKMKKQHEYVLIPEMGWQQHYFKKDFSR
ncbi:hypothetical protein [Aeromonas jandaei]|uniref:hypothetical protein n=1 Tax=Aeromonas jandaei TaxID=650 RepID=UPI0012DFA15F|nr:hypothetical protein [Aeromonas jandaei]